MTTWNKISRDNLTAAGELMRLGHYRSSVSRAYYAAYAAVAQALTARKLRFADNRDGPSHAALRRMAEANIGRVSRGQRARLLGLLNRLYEWRIDADYRPGVTVDRGRAKEAVLAAGHVLGIIGF